MTAVTYEASVLRVLIASPGDLAQQRDLVERSVWDWNRGRRSERQRVVLLPVRWEADAVPRQGMDAQWQIDEQLLRDADVVIAFFHSRLGTPTADFPSGTAQEIENTRVNRLATHIFISSAPVPRSHDSDQLRQLKEYERDLGQRGLLGTFATDTELRSLVDRSLEDDVERFRSSRETAAVHRASVGRIPIDKNAAAIRRMRAKLSSGDFLWRSIESLASAAGISALEAFDLLSAEPDVRFSKGKSGQRIARISEDGQ